jgi:hypothetical protein
VVGRNVPTIGRPNLVKPKKKARWASQFVIETLFKEAQKAVTSIHHLQVQRNFEVFVRGTIENAS